MNPRILRVLTLAVLLGATFVANPPPGQLLGHEIDILVWSLVLGLAVVAGIVTLVAAGRTWAYALLVPMALAVMGPRHAFASLGFFANAVAAWALLLHLELMTFEARRSRWAASADEGATASLNQYERAYGRAVASLAGLVLVVFAAIIGLYRLVLALAPASLARSVEAANVEGLAGALVVTAVLVVALKLLFGRAKAAEPTPEELPAEASP